MKSILTSVGEINSPANFEFTGRGEEGAALLRLGPSGHSERFNSLTNFPRGGHGARELRARRDFCRRCPVVPPPHLLRDAPVPTGPSDAAQGPNVRVR